MPQLKLHSSPAYADAEKSSIKDNVHKFDEDVAEAGSYLYTTERRSARTANERLSRSISEAYDFKNKSVLDIGCGDGAYTVEFANLGAKEVMGVDPAAAAIVAAEARAEAKGVNNITRFEVGNIYELEPYLEDQRFDCIVLRGVLHHLPDPARAIAGLSSFKGSILIVEPNGNNPILKMLEKYSRYHIDHEERSFSPSSIRGWLRNAEFRIEQSKVVNLVPFFCPDWAVAPLKWMEILVEHIPIVRAIVCGQSIILASKRN